jgi:HNH endonuclease/AP2 domain
MSKRHPVPQLCSCGCGQMTKDQHLGDKPYVTGHQNRGRSAWHLKKEPGFPDGTQLDDEDQKRFGIYRWSLSGNGYLQRHHTKEDGKHTKIRLHQEIMGFPKGVLIDHINGNKLDNRRQNLRIVDDKGNSENQARSSKNTSGFRGVSWNKAAKKWQAYVHENRKMIHLGFYDDLNQAAEIAAEYRRQHYKSYVER